MLVTNIDVPEDDKLPDHKNWINRFIYRSKESGSHYTIAQERTKRFWACSCTGNVIHKKCKHLLALGLPTRQIAHECTVTVIKKRTLEVRVPVTSGEVVDFAAEDAGARSSASPAAGTSDMAISNWLTRDEWNAVYFAGLGEALEGKPCPDLGVELRLGIGALHRAGYKFTGITSTPEGDYTKERQCCDGNEKCLAELISGEFDWNGRAREHLAWAETNLPTMDFSWLKKALEQTENA